MDAYVKIMQVMQRQGAKNNPPSIYIGTVISPPPNLVIQTTDNMSLYNDDILIADYLLSGCSRQVSITGGSGTAIQTTDTALKVDDTVILMPTIDMQTWILLCKVVSV